MQPIQYLNSETTVEHITALITQATTECAAESVSALINQRMMWGQCSQEKSQRPDQLGDLAVAAHYEYNADPIKYRRGKVILKRLTSLLQSAFHKNLRIFFPSPFLNSRS